MCSTYFEFVRSLDLTLSAFKYSCVFERFTAWSPFQLFESGRFDFTFNLSASALGKSLEGRYDPQRKARILRPPVPSDSLDSHPV